MKDVNDCMPSRIEEILRAKIKPKEKQAQLVNAVCNMEVSVNEFISFFQTALNSDKGTCADVIKHIAINKPKLLFPYFDILIQHINHPLPRVKWGIPEAIGNMAKYYPEKAAETIPFLLKNTYDHKLNTTVIKWCSAFALGEIAKYHIPSRDTLLPVFENIIKSDQNNGVKNVYVNALKSIKKR